jgi:3-oxoacyl-[acyl-carrier protein] reductase
VTQPLPSAATTTRIFAESLNCPEEKKMNRANLLKNKVAIVTGAGRGVGRAAALSLAQAGAAVVLAARSTDQITGVADEIKQNGGQALAIATDVSDTAQVDHLLVLTLRAFQHIDILVNNAAVAHPIGKVWETSPRAWQELMAINVTGPYLCARSVLPHMLDRGSGHIINISSGAADSNIEGLSAYNASKAALERFSGVLAEEVNSYGLVVTVLRPGIVDTAMQTEIRQTPVHRLPKVGLWQKWHQQNLLREAGEPADAILWLSSSFANGSNGHIFSIDDELFQQRIAADLAISPIPVRKR